MWRVGVELFPPQPKLSTVASSSDVRCAQRLCESGGAGRASHVHAETHMGSSTGIDISRPDRPGALRDLRHGHADRKPDRLCRPQPEQRSNGNLQGARLSLRYTAVWAPYSGDANHSPFKSGYYNQ